MKNPSSGWSLRLRVLGKVPDESLWDVLSMLTYNSQTESTCVSPGSLVTLAVVRPAVLSVLNGFSTFNQNSFKHLQHKRERSCWTLLERECNLPSPSVHLVELLQPVGEFLRYVLQLFLRLLVLLSLRSFPAFLVRPAPARKHRASILTPPLRSRTVATLDFHSPWNSLVLAVRPDVQLSISSVLLVRVFLVTLWRQEGGGGPPILQREVKNIWPSAK